MFISPGGGSTPSAGPTQGALALGTRAVQVTKLDPAGAIIYRAEFSGPQGYGGAKSIAADAQGNVWVAGRASPDFPTTPNALLPTAPATSAGSWGFLAELNSSGTALLYSTFTDGSGFSPQIALDGAGNIYETDSTAAEPQSGSAAPEEPPYCINKNLPIRDSPASRLQ